MPKWGGGGKIEGRHILIIAMSEHHVDYMNRKGCHSVIMQGGTFSPMCTSDSMDSCMAPFKRYNRTKQFFTAVGRLHKDQRQLSCHQFLCKFTFFTM